MWKGFGSAWRRLGLVEKAFLIVLAVWLALYFSGISSLAQSLVGLTGFFLGLAALFRVARRGMRKAIWRLRNRLIAAYLFIAVVPIVLILTLVGFAGWAVIGQMAVYLVNTELTHREQALLFQRSEEHTSELQSLRHLVCRLLLEKKKNNICCRLAVEIVSRSLTQFCWSGS